MFQVRILYEFHLKSEVIRTLIRHQQATFFAILTVA